MGWEERWVGGQGGEGVEWWRVRVCRRIILDVDVGLRFDQQAAYVNVAHKSSQKEGSLVPDPDE
jgi:hypothetical protein